MSWLKTEDMQSHIDKLRHIVDNDQVPDTTDAWIARLIVAQWECTVQICNRLDALSAEVEEIRDASSKV